MERLSKKQLIQKKLELESTLYDIEKRIGSYELGELEEKYGENFTCEKCRYSATYTLSEDGYHTLCGKDKCVYCEGRCVKYKPDNLTTKMIKDTRDHWGGYLIREQATSLRDLGADIFADEPSQYTIDMLKLFLDYYGK